MRYSILDVTLTAFEPYLLLQSSYSLQKTYTQLNVRDCLERDIKGTYLTKYRLKHKTVNLKTIARQYVSIQDPTYENNLQD